MYCTFLINNATIIDIVMHIFQDDVISAQDALPQKTSLTLSDEPR